MNLSKLCKDCGCLQPVSLFGKHAKTRDRLDSFCKPCRAKRVAAYRAANPERAKASVRASVAKHRKAINARKRERRTADPVATQAQRKADYVKYRDRELTSMRAWKAANRAHMQAQALAKYWADPVAARARQTAYRAANPVKARHWRMTRIATELRAVPPWADLARVSKAYEAADFLMMVTGDWYEVDHIVPLRGAIGRKHVVCGLHVSDNLQVLPMSENRRKSNVFWPGMPGV